MGADFSAELLKSGKRPSTWVLATVLVAGVLIFGYVLSYAFALALSGAEEPPSRAGEVSRESGAGGTVSPGAQNGRKEMLDGLLPSGLLSNLLPAASTLGGTMALIFGVLSLGGEYGWGTLKTVLTQQSSRTALLAGKSLAVATVLVAFVMLVFAVGAAGSYGVALLEQSPVHWPPIGELLRGMGALWLILMAWASFGILLAAVFGGSTLATGLGLAYALVLEPFAVGMPSKLEALETARRLLLGQSSSSLAGAFDPAATGATMAGASSPDPVLAMLSLAAYAVVFLSLAALVLHRRDVGL